VVLAIGRAGQEAGPGLTDGVSSSGNQLSSAGLEWQMSLCLQNVGLEMSSVVNGRVGKEKTKKDRS